MLGYKPLDTDARKNSLERILLVCTEVQIKQCLNVECQKRRQRMTNAPASKWKPFRDWSLTLMACLLYACDQSWKQWINAYGEIIGRLFAVTKNTQIEETSKDIDFFGVCELTNWMWTVLCQLNPTYQENTPTRTHITEKRINEAHETAVRLGICPSRLWNLAVLGAERQEMDLPTVMMMLEGNLNYIAYSRPGSNHSECTEEVCYFSSVDSTRVKQMHKCSAGSCTDILKFPAFEFNKPRQRFAWWLHDNEDVPKVIDEKEPYMAISHVWSDSTGEGTQGQGNMNRCLFSHFQSIARTLGCTAI